MSLSTIITIIAMGYQIMGYGMESGDEGSGEDGRMRG